MKAIVLASVFLALLTTQPASAQAAARAPGQFVSVNGINLHYQVRGEGEPLLLLHGFGMCGPVEWGHIVDDLAKQYKIVLVDLRGHGWSTNPSGKFTLRQSAEDVRGLLDHMELPSVRAMGISAGGMTLLQLASRYPARISAMVIIGATNRFPEQARRTIEMMGKFPLPPDIAQAMESCASRGPGQVSELMAQFQDFRDSHDDMNLGAKELGRIRAKTLIVHGDRDEFFPVEVPVELYRSIQGSSLWIVPEGGHVPIHEQRQAEFLRIIHRHLDSSADAQGAGKRETSRQE